MQGALKSFALKSLRQRECGIYEAADKLLGYHMYNFSDPIYFLNAQKYDFRKKRLKEINDVKELEDESTDIYCPNLIDVYYPNRSDVSKLFLRICFLLIIYLKIEFRILKPYLCTK